MKHSSKYDLSFITNQSGKLLILNSSDSIVKTFTFPTGGYINVDQIGDLASFSGYDDIIRFFDISSLLILDSIKLNNGGDSSTFSTWFTKSGIFIGNNQHNFNYDILTKKLIEIKSLSSYRIIDYHSESNQFIVGYWDNNLISYDYKIKSLYLASPNNDFQKKFCIKTNSWIQSAYFMENGTKLIVKDTNSIFIFDFYTSEIRTPVNDTIFTMNKFNDNTVILLTPYRGNKKEYNREMIFFDVNSHRITQTISVVNPPYLDNIISNIKSNNIYMISIYDGTESSIIVIK